MGGTKGKGGFARMTGSQIYIGTPNGVVLCVDQRERNRIQARYYTSYKQEPTFVENWDQLLFEMEHFFDEIQFPFSATNNRSFGEIPPKEYFEGRKERIMKDEELLRKHGDLGSFIIRVQHRQNSSWQGRITWVEKNQTMLFRSVWEMIKLMESALDTVSPPDDPDESLTWPESE